MMTEASSITISIRSKTLTKAKQLNIPVEVILSEELSRMADRLLLPLIQEYGMNCDRTDYVPSWIEQSGQP